MNSSSSSSNRIGILFWLILVLLIFLIAQISNSEARRRCRCKNGGRCARNGLCRCKFGAGYFGDKCELPCVDIYNSCKIWKGQGRCSYRRGANRFFLDNCPVSCRECIFNPKAAPKGTPLAPVLRPLEMLIGKWQAETTGSFRYPVPFTTTSSGYKEIIQIKIAKLPAFDTPYLKYSSTAYSSNDKENVQSEVGFIWIKLGKNATKQIANMITTNTGLTVIQEGLLNKNAIKFNSTTYKQFLPGGIANNVQLDLEATRIFQFTENRLTQVIIDKDRYFYQKIYERLE